ncbi:MAG: SDR family oxidoreductase [Burkholderiaceae bacterium]|nr:SDR family oxidoreductase [Burkholderiaceae bacterium]
MKDFSGKVAVITGAGSGFGREFARIGAKLGMKLVLADVQDDALDAVASELRAQGAGVLARHCDVARGADVQALADSALERFGAIHLAFNNAGVTGTGGFIWENSEADWHWTLGVNLWGVVHGIRVFVPIMLAQDCECHVVNTASVAGLVSPQMMGVYNVSKHAVVTASETLFQDLRIAQAKVGVSVLCPAFVATAIFDSDRNRPASLRNDGPQTESQEAAQRQGEQAARAGKLSAADVAERTFDAIREQRFYVITHPRILQSVELRLHDIVAQRNPSDPYSFKPDPKFGSKPGE